jgi:hypothetical protein
MMNTSPSSWRFFRSCWLVFCDHLAVRLSFSRMLSDVCTADDLTTTDPGPEHIRHRSNLTEHTAALSRDPRASFGAIWRRFIKPYTRDSFRKNPPHPHRCSLSQWYRHLSTKLKDESTAVQHHVLVWRRGRGPDG